MSKKRREVEAADADEQDRSPVTACNTLDHVYPSTKPDTRCYCGKKVWRPFIALDNFLEPGMLVRTYAGGPIYEVEMVNKSRARCRVITAQAILSRRNGSKELLPMPGMEVLPPVVMADTEDEEEERRGRVINISPRSAVIRVSAAELEQETLTTRSSTMAKQLATIPVAGKSSKEREQDRRDKLAAKPNGAAKPLYGAAAKAKANSGSRPKPVKTVRACGCGCGGETMAYFVPGHDARYKGWLKKLASGELDQAGLKKLMGAKVFGKYTFKKVGTGFAPKESYQEAAG